MSIKAKISNKDGATVDVIKRSGTTALVVLNQPYSLYNSRPLAFINTTVGNNMVQNGATGGTPEIIHNGVTSTEWTGSIISGTWDFSTGGVITATSMLNNEAATFSEETPTTVDVTGYVSLSMQVDLDAYDPSRNSMQVQFDLVGVPVGDTLNIDAYINTGDFAQQQASIPLGDFNFGSNDVDGFTISFTRSGGTKPTVKFDNIQLNQTGTPFTFRIVKDDLLDYHIYGLRYTLVDNITAIEYDKFMGLNALTNGITFQRVQDGKVNFSASLKQVSDLLQVSGRLYKEQGAANLLVNIQIDLVEPILLKGKAADNYMSLTINDDLTDLLKFTVFAQGAEVTN